MACATEARWYGSTYGLRNVSLDVSDVRQVDGGLLEMRVHYGPGHRLYYLREGSTLVLPCGGGKSGQQCDIERTGRLADDWRQT